ncbi:MAG: GDSL-type esterase/lipase family protein [Candidatus Dojkabacteria bacterium]|jgi:lysophospholipase L1-like esterase|nr:GDSL-type esterase/lipase family protein [Candidatus Dojkabacteria bacterium]
MARLCIFGDSISFGVYDPENGGWANLLKLNWLEKSQFNQIYDLSISGINSTSILERIRTEGEQRLALNHKNENSIILSIGLNDSKLINNKKPFIPLEQFQKNVSKILMISKQMAKNVLVVGLTPAEESKTNPVSWNNSEFYNNNEIERYNQVLRQVSEKESTQFIDIFSSWINIDYKKLLFDGLHPNTKGHKGIFKMVMRVMRYKK